MAKKSFKKEHSVPVPRFYKEAAKILRRVSDGEGLQDLIFSCNHRNIKGIYALVCNSMKNNTLLENIVSESGIECEKLDPYLTKVLITELLWGKQHLPGDSKPVKAILDCQSQLQEAAKNADIPVELEVRVTKPRYVRINTLLTTIQGTIQQFRDQDWELVDTPDSYESYLECIANLTEEQFMQDYHFDDLLVFAPKSQFHDHPLVEKGHLILQDKSSYLPAHLLNPEPGSVVLDMCAAPGIKTAHLVNLMKNNGTVFAVDRDPKRFQVMVNKLQQYCGRHNCVESKIADSTHVTSEKYPGVRYILLDPSCSGTGMSKRIEDSVNSSVDSLRLQKLSNFQERLLVQSLTAFPDVERVVYSTCSILQEENEQVLERVLARVPEFQVVAPNLEKPWERRGDSQYRFGPNCLVADLEKDLTNGFFVAVLERIGKKVSAKKKQLKRKSSEIAAAAADDDDGWEFPKKKKQIKRRTLESNDEFPLKKKKKQHRKEKNDSE